MRFSPPKPIHNLKKSNARADLLKLSIFCSVTSMWCVDTIQAASTPKSTKIAWPDNSSLSFFSIHPKIISATPKKSEYCEVDIYPKNDSEPMVIYFVFGKSVNF